MDNQLSIQLKKDFRIAGRIAKNSDRQEINYIKIQTGKGKMKIEATDSYRLFRKEYGNEEISNIENSSWQKHRIVYLYYDKVKDFIDSDFDLENKQKLLLISDVKYPDTSILKVSKKITLMVATEPLKQVIEAFRKIKGAENNMEFRAKPKDKLVIFNKVLKARLKANVVEKYQHFYLNPDLLIDLIDDTGQFTLFAISGGDKPIGVNGSIIMPVKND